MRAWYQGNQMLLYVDPFCGAAGDMLLGAWIAIGADVQTLRETLVRLNVPGFGLEIRQEKRCGIAGTRVVVHVEETRAHRTLADVTAIVRSAGLSEAVCERAVAVFEALARAEAEVHGSDIRRVHFHEVGTHDAIIDIVGSVLCLDLLGWPEVICGPVHVGSGIVQCRHGCYPVPAPATACLLRGKPIVNHGVEAELVTPTGAALLVTLAQRFGPMPPMVLEQVGYGVGTRDNKPWPNVVRVLKGRSGPVEAAPIAVLETHIDDMNPEQYGYVLQKLFAAGALDVALAPIQMKENRPGTRLTVLAPVGQEHALADVVLRETTSLGVRWYVAQRFAKEREQKMVRTPWGDVPVKVAHWEGAVSIAPEYKACREIAEKTGVPLHQVYDAVRKAYET